jgi:hypothetical protein
VTLIQNHVEIFARGPYVGNGVLRDDAAIVFNLDLKLVVRQNALTELQDLCEAAGLQPVIDILTYVRLKDNRLARSNDPAAIDEVFHDVADFRDMGMRRDVVAIRQSETQKSIRMLFENGTKLR